MDIDIKQYEKILWNKYKKGERTEEDILKQYTNIAKTVAKRMKLRYQHIEYDELYQNALIGVWKAIPRFDPSKNITFRTFASNVCVNTIKEELRKEDPIPRRIRGKKKKLEEAIDNEKETKLDEIMIEMGITKKQYVSMVIQYNATQQKSIDEKHNDKVKDKTDIEMDFLKKEEMSELRQAFSMLNKREQMLIQSLFHKGNTKSKTATLFIQSIGGIRYEEAKALKKLYYAIHIIRNNYNFKDFKLDGKLYKFSIDEIAEKTGVHRQTIYKWKRGHLPNKKTANKLIETIIKMTKKEK